jgi:predicted HD superfamily hydrolase involved in NAD metabolism
VTIVVLENKIEEIKHVLRQMLDEKRLAHIFSVCETAVLLAERFGADKNKAYLAALLHDCARGLNEEQLINYCNENGIRLDRYMKSDINPVHALVGADMAKRRFGIHDEEILNAIRNHAVGCEDMTILDKIIFVADAIEPNRTGSDVNKAREASENDLDEAIVHSMRIKSYYLKGKPLHPCSIKMLEKLNRENVSRIVISEDRHDE